MASPDLLAVRFDARDLDRIGLGAVRGDTRRQRNLEREKSDGFPQQATVPLLRRAQVCTESALRSITSSIAMWDGASIVQTADFGPTSPLWFGLPQQCTAPSWSAAHAQ